MRSATDGRGPAQLALPARPPHRRLRADPGTMARVKSRRKPVFDDDAQAEASPGHISCRMPAEWEPHEATWLAWPHERTDWPGKFAPIPWVYADIVRHLARVERVRI